MSGLLKKAFLIALTAFLIQCFAQPVLAIENYQTGTILFQDNFNSGNLNKWTADSGVWLIDSVNRLLGYKSGRMYTGRLNAHSDDWDNYQIDLDIRMDAGVDAGIGFRRQDPNNTYEVTLRFDPGKNSYNTPELVFHKVQNGVSSIVFSTHNVPLVINKDYHLKIQVYNSHIQMWINDLLAFDLDDPNTTVKTGGLSLSYWTGDIAIVIARFDNVIVSSLTKPKFPVIFIPGIGGSELKANQDIFWANKDDGHGGEYSHAYSSGEKIWVNNNQAAMPGNDDYFDVLKLKTDGLTSEADIGLTGWMTPEGYGGVYNFFQNAGYIKDTNFFVFTYDWRKDVATTEADLAALIALAKQKTGLPQVNIVSHSMGGLVARSYIQNPTYATSVNKLIELGVPHLGTPDGLNTLLAGKALGRQLLGDLYLGLSSSETKDVLQNSSGLAQLFPSKTYYQFYNNTTNQLPYPFVDYRDIDNNKITGPLNYPQTKDLLSNLQYNMNPFNIAESFHTNFDSKLNQPNNVKLYECIGTGQPTLGQIQESYLITWPINLIPKRDEIFINGDDSVPVYSASLTNGSIDLSAGAKIYYTDQHHSDLVNENGACMQTVKTILNEGDTFPASVLDQKISLEGQQISVDDATLDIYDEANHHTGINDNGQVETNIPDTAFDVQDNTHHAFIKKTAPKVKVKVKSTKNKASPKIRKYAQDNITKTDIYKDIPVDTNNPTTITIDNSTNTPPQVSSNGQSYDPTTTLDSNNSLDITPPISTNKVEGAKNDTGDYTAPVNISFTANDNQSGVDKIEYAINNSELTNYTQPFSITDPGQFNITFYASDKAGNQELPQNITLVIANPPSPSPSPTPTPTPSPSPTTQPTPTPSPLPTPNPSETPSTELANLSSPTPTPTATENPSSTPSPSPSPSMQESASPSPTPSPTDTPSPSPTNNPTPTSTSSPTPTASPSPSPIASIASLYRKSPTPTENKPLPTASPSKGEVLGESISNQSGKSEAPRAEALGFLQMSSNESTLFSWLIFYPLYLLIILVILFLTNLWRSHKTPKKMD